MKHRKWSPIQIQEALSLSKKVNYSVSGISINSKKSNIIMIAKKSPYLAFGQAIRLIRCGISGFF